MTFRRVIVAFDGSPQGEDALALALRLCDRSEGVLTLACVVNGQRWHVGPEVRRPDAPVPELAESEDADLIVVGSSAHAEAGRVRLERTAGRLLQVAPCAVAIAPGGLRESDDFPHVAVAGDDSPEIEGAPHPVLVMPATTTESKEPTMTATTSEPSLETYTVLNALQLGLIERPADADVRSLAAAMAEHRVHSVVVKGIQGPLGWGIVSDLDLMAAMRPEVGDTTAGQIAATDPVIVQAADTLAHAAQLMAEHQTAHLIVVDPVTREPVGIVSTLDIARYMAG
jgi:CBS domain-containing protein/nucleotide-binding universal stress UspA family protein